MITDQERRANVAAGELFEVLVKHCNHRRVLSRQVIDELEDLVKQFTALTRSNGIDFPDLVVLVLPESGGVEVVRRDLDETSIQALIVRCAHKYPTTNASELAKAVRRAFPHYRNLH